MAINIDRAIGSKYDLGILTHAGRCLCFAVPLGYWASGNQDLRLQSSREVGQRRLSVGFSTTARLCRSLASRACVSSHRGSYVSSLARVTSVIAFRLGAIEPNGLTRRSRELCGQSLLVLCRWSIGILTSLCTKTQVSAMSCS